MNTDTIAAIATAVNNSGISIIRVSGDAAINIVGKIFYSKSGEQKLETYKSHTIHYGYIKDQKQFIDEVLVSIMKAEKSYTMEDIVEINCHGGFLVTKKILETVIKYGARPAEPGEFTKRAFLNGRLDLSQAEAVMDVISAKSEYALQSSVNQLKGNICNKIIELRNILIKNIAFIEAVLDDPEHYEFGDFVIELNNILHKVENDLIKMLKSSDAGRLVKEGIVTVIVGKPNAGKSSLLNLLAGEERAIVTDVAGTTRDIIEQYIQLDGICLNIVDTAGIRETDNVVERIGVDKALQYIDKADLILYVVDATNELDQDDLQIIEKIKNKVSIVLLNKSDLNCKVTVSSMEKYMKHPVLAISVKTECGIIELQELIKDMFFSEKLNFNDQVYITNIRHKHALEDSLDSIHQVMNSIEAQMPEDFLTIDLMNAYEKLGEIIGETVDEDLINTIFSQFCMGK